MMAVFTLIAVMVVFYAFIREARMRMKRPLPAAPKDFSRPAQRPLLDRLTDPKESAAILLVKTAALSGQVTVDHKSRILELMANTFGADSGEAEGLFSFGRMAVGRLEDPAQSLKRILRPVHDSLTLAEMNDLVRMMEAVSAVEGLPNNDQQALIMATRRALRLDHTSPLDG